MINGIIVEVHLRFALSLKDGASAVTDFKVSKLFKIPLKSNRIINITEVYLLPLMVLLHVGLLV